MGLVRLELLEDRLSKGEELPPRLQEEYGFLSSIHLDPQAYYISGRISTSRFVPPFKHLLDRGYIYPKPSRDYRRAQLL